MDKLSPWLTPHQYHAEVFYNAVFCGNNAFDDDAASGQLHLLRAGRVVMHHPQAPALALDQPALVFYPAGMAHGLQVDAAEPAHLLCARIQYARGARDGLPQALPAMLHVRPEQVDGLAPLLALLYAQADSALPGQQLLLDRLCDVVLAHVLRHAYLSGRLDAGVLGAQRGHGYPGERGMARLLASLHAHPEQLWDLPRMAEVAGMSRSKFSRFFHDTQGVTPADYLSERRMLMAQKLLGNGGTVQSVAHKVGYASQSAFSKAFTARRGMSPRAWLQSRPA